MKILALEFSSERRSVAIAADGLVLGQADETGGPRTRAFALIEKALAEAKLEREQIDCLAIGLGPGSYAGVRVAIAVAQGWQMARSVRLLGISSVDALAWRAVPLVETRINFLIDAQRKEFYFAAYELGPTTWTVLEPLCLLSAEEARRRLANGELVIQPELIGAFPNGRAQYPDAAALASLAGRRADFVSGDQLEPIYLRETSFVKAPPSRSVPVL
jgi:tRNA threonylcarbamoyl adenosine modification protein YeaZ